MNKEDARKKELSAMLVLIYQQGFAYENPQLFDNEPLKKIKSKRAKESIRFYKLIKEEAIKRNMKPLDLIDFYCENLDHRKELINLLEPDKAIQFKPISKTESLVPHNIMEISKMVNITQLSKRDYKGTINTIEYGEMEKWEKKIPYLVKKIDFLEKMESRIPKPNAYLDKVIKALIFLIQQEANKSDIPITQAKGSFYLLDMAKFLNMEYRELKRTLICGACIVYEYPHKINGMNYKYYGSWYDLEIPEDNKNPWYFEFHGLYRDQICSVLNSGKQYLKHPIKEIIDNKTHKKEYLHSFYNNLIYSNLPINVEKLLIKSGAKE